MLSSESPPCKVDPRLLPGNLDLGSNGNDKGGSLCPNCWYKTMWSMTNACFSSGSLEFWEVGDRGCLCDQPTVKLLGTESVISFPGRQHFPCVVTVCCWRNEAHPMWLSWERTLGSLQRVFPGRCPMYLFPLLILPSVVSLQWILAVSTIVCWIPWVLLANHRI